MYLHKYVSTYVVYKNLGMCIVIFAVPINILYLERAIIVKSNTLCEYHTNELEIRLTDKLDNPIPLIKIKHLINSPHYQNKIKSMALLLVTC